MRKRAAELIGENVPVVEKVALTLSRDGEEVRLMPFGYIPDIWLKTEKLLDENER